MAARGENIVNIRDRRDLRLGPLGRAGERAIVVNCAAVGLVVALLFVLERVGASQIVVGTASLSAPLASILVLAFLGRTMEAGTFLRADRGGGSLVTGLSLTGEFAPLLLVPAALSAATLRAGGTPWLVSAGLGLALFALLVAPPMRRTGADGLIDFLRMRLKPSRSSRLARIVLALAIACSGAGLLWIEGALVNRLAGTLGATTGTTAMGVTVAVAAVVVLLGGLRSVTLVNAYLGFLLALAFTVPAVLTQAGLATVQATLAPLAEVSDRLLPPMRGWADLALVVLGIAVVPIWIVRQSAVGPGRGSVWTAWALLIGFVAVAAIFVLPEQEASRLETSRVVSLLPALGWLSAAWGAMMMTLFVTARALVLLGGQPRTGPAGWLVRTAAIRFATVALAAALVWLGARLEWWLEPWMLPALMTGTAAVLAPTVLALVAWPRAEAWGTIAAPILGATGIALGALGVVPPLTGAWGGALAGAIAIAACGYLFDDRSWRMRWLNPATEFPPVPR